jgi:hypothetical protein
MLIIINGIQAQISPCVDVSGLATALHKMGLVHCRSVEIVCEAGDYRVVGNGITIVNQEKVWLIYQIVFNVLTAHKKTIWRAEDERLVNNVNQNIS